MFYFITMVTHNRCPVFQNEDIANILFRIMLKIEVTYDTHIFAFVIMPDHVHLLTDTVYWIYRFKGYSAKMLIAYMKERKISLLNDILLYKPHAKKRWYQFWQKKMNYQKSDNKKFFSRTIHYILMNPVTAGLVSDWKDYPWIFIRQNNPYKKISRGASAPREKYISEYFSKPTVKEYNRTDIIHRIARLG